MAIFRPPLIQRYPAGALPQGAQALQGWVAGLNLQLTGGGAEPFYQTDWPSPRIPFHHTSNKTHTFALSLPLYGKDVQFGPPGMGQDYYYPNPTVFPDRVANRTWTNALSLLLCNQDVQFRAPGQGQSYDYPNPRIPFVHPSNRTWTQSTQIQAILPVNPFFQTDWPRPLVAGDRSSNRTHIQTPSLLLQDQQFGAAGQGKSYDYPNPRIPVPAANLTYQEFAGIWQYPVSTTLPFSQTDWPNPRTQTYHPSKQILTRFTGNLRPPVVNPFTQLDWPNPVTPIYQAANRRLIQSTPVLMFPATVVALLACGCSPYGDGTPYGNGELYCDSTYTRRAYIVLQDLLVHTLSFRLQASGPFTIDSVRGLLNERATRPFQYQVDANQTAMKTLSIRVQATGCMDLNAMYPIIKIRKQQPVV